MHARGTDLAPGASRARHEHASAPQGQPLRSGGWFGLDVYAVAPSDGGAPAVRAPCVGWPQRVAALPECAARRGSGFCAVELHGLDAILQDDGRPRAPEASIFAFTHLDGPGDFLLAAALWRRLGTRDGSALAPPLALSRRPNNFLEAVLDRVLLAGIVAEVVKEEQAPGEDSAARADRQAKNAGVIAGLSHRAATEGRPVVIYPEGALSDDGLVRARGTGCLQARPPGGAIVLVAQAFEPLAPGGIEVACGIEVLIEPTARAAAHLQERLVRRGPVTLTAVVGAYLMWRRGRCEAPVAEAELQNLGGHAAGRLAECAEVLVHGPFMDAERRTARVTYAWDALVTRGYVDADGALTAKLGVPLDPRVPEGAPQHNRAGDRPHLRDPLWFWGNRLNQHAAYDAPLRRALDAAFAATLAGTAVPLAAPRPLQHRPCPIM